MAHPQDGQSGEATLSLWRCFVCFFVSIATILGTGILGLPVKLSEAGVWPFLPTFALCLLMQSASVVIMTDLLQRAQHLLSLLPHKRMEPNLHGMGMMFLSGPLRSLFMVMVVVHFIAISISYSLAAATSYSQLFRTLFGVAGAHAGQFIAPVTIVLVLVRG